MSTRARAEKVSISLSFSLSSKTIVVVVFAFVGESVAHDKSEKKKEKTVVSQSVVWFCFSLPKQTRKRPQKKIKILPLLTLLYSSANDNTIHINIKTVWRAWMNSKSPKAEETKGTEI